MPVRHVVGILIRPGSTWLALRDEPLGQGEIFRRLVAPLALIGPVCGSIGLLVFGPGIAGIRLQPSPTATLAAAGLSYVLTLVAAYVLAFVIGGLAPLFGGAGGRGQALKLVAYAGVPLWLSGLFALYPTLGFAIGALGALDSLFVLYLGLPRLMDVAERQALSFFALIVLVVIMLAVIARVALALIP